MLAHKQSFDADPSRYEPQYGGFCASGAAFAIKLGSDPTEWQIVDGRLFIFGDVLGHSAWGIDPAWNIQHADQVWAEARDTGWRWQSLKRYAVKVPWYKNSADIRRDFEARYPGRAAPRYDPGGMLRNLFIESPGWRAREGFSGQPVVGFVGEDACPPACPGAVSQGFHGQVKCRFAGTCRCAPGSKPSMTQYLPTTHAPHPLRRRLLTGAAGWVAMPAFIRDARAQERLRLTPSQTEGPYYPVTLPADSDADLLVQGDSRYTQGEAAWLEGKVTDAAGRALSGGVVEIWQCDQQGRYHHPGDGGRADPNFQGFRTRHHRCRRQLPVSHHPPGALRRAHAAHPRQGQTGAP